MENPTNPTEKRKVANVDEEIARLETLKQTNEKLRVPSAIQQKIDADIARLKQQKQAMEDWSDALKEKRVGLDLPESEKIEERIERGPETKTEGLDMFNKFEAAVAGAVAEVRESGDELKEQVQTLPPAEQEQVAAAVNLADAQAQSAASEAKQEISKTAQPAPVQEPSPEITEAPSEAEKIAIQPVAPQEATQVPETTPMPETPLSPETAFETFQRLKNEARFGKEDAEKLIAGNILKTEAEGGQSEQLEKVIQTLLKEKEGFWLTLDKKSKEDEAKVIQELERGLKDYFGKEGEQLRTACQDIFYAFKARFTERASQEDIEGRLARLATPKTIKGKLLKGLGYTAVGFAGTAFLGVGGIIATGALRQLDSAYSRRLSTKKLEQYKNRVGKDESLQQELKQDLADLIVSKKRTDLLAEKQGWQAGEQGEYAAENYKEAALAYLEVHQPEWLESLRTEEQKQQAREKMAESIATFYAIDDSTEKMNKELEQTKAGKWQQLADFINKKVPLGGLTDPGPMNKFYTGAAAAGIGTGLIFAARGSKTIRRLTMAYVGYKLGAAAGELYAGKKSPEAVVKTSLENLKAVTITEVTDPIILNNYSKEIAKARAALAETARTTKNKAGIERMQKELAKHEFALLNEAVLQRMEQAAQDVDEITAGLVSGKAEQEARKEITQSTGRAKRYKLYGRVGGAVVGYIGADIMDALIGKAKEKLAALREKSTVKAAEPEAAVPKKPELPTKEELEFLKPEETAPEPRLYAVRPKGEIEEIKPLEFQPEQGLKGPKLSELSKELEVPLAEKPPTGPPALELETEIKVSKDVELPEDIAPQRPEAQELVPAEIPPLSGGPPEGGASTETETSQITQEMEQKMGAELEDLQRARVGRWRELSLKERSQMIPEEKIEYDRLSAEIPEEIRSEIVSMEEKPAKFRGKLTELWGKLKGSERPMIEGEGEKPAPVWGEIKEEHGLPAVSEKEDFLRLMPTGAKAGYQTYEISYGFGNKNTEIKLPQDIKLSEIETFGPKKMGFVAFEHKGKQLIGMPKIEQGELKIYDANSKEFDIQRIVGQLKRGKPFFGKFHSYTAEQLNELKELLPQ